MASRSYAVHNTRRTREERVSGHGKAVSRDLSRQAEEKADLLNPMREKNSAEPARDNPFVALVFMLAGVALGTVFMIVILNLIGA